MEKLGVEQETRTRVHKPRTEKLEKTATPQPEPRPQTTCDHPEGRLIRSEGVVFCRKCEKYLKI